MKKRLLALLLAVGFGFGLTACGGNKSAEEIKTESTEETAVEKETEEVAEEEAEANLIGGEEMGEGKVYLVNESGTTQDGNVIWFKNEDYQLLQIGLESEGMDGSLETIIYVDGKEHTREQLADSQTSLELTGENLTPGIHSVELVQEGTFYRLMQYEVK